MTLLWVSGCPFILVPFVWVQVWVRVRLGPQPFGYGGGTGEVGLFFPWKKHLASLRHLFSGGKNNPTSPSVTISGHSLGKTTHFQGPTSGAGSTPPSRNSEADLPVHLRNARLKLDRSA